VSGPDKIISLLELFIEEDDNRALDEALRLVGETQFNITGLLQHLENFRGDLPRKRRAISLARKQLGLSMIPGPVCGRAP
jgi:hypothetical protein